MSHGLENAILRLSYEFSINCFMSWKKFNIKSGLIKNCVDQRKQRLQHNMKITSQCEQHFPSASKTRSKMSPSKDLGAQLFWRFGLSTCYKEFIMSKILFRCEANFFQFFRVFKFNSRWVLSLGPKFELMPWIWGSCRPDSVFEFLTNNFFEERKVMSLPFDRPKYEQRQKSRNKCVPFEIEMWILGCW